MKTVAEVRGSGLAVDETVILLHPPLSLVGVSTGMERERQQNGSLVNGWVRQPPWNKPGMYKRSGDGLDDWTRPAGRVSWWSCAEFRTISRLTPCGQTRSRFSSRFSASSVHRKDP